MRTNHLGIAALSALVSVLAWTALSQPSSVPNSAARPVVTTAIRWELQPANCEDDCLRGYHWGIRHEVTERKDCRALASEALGGCLRVVQAVERFDAEDVAELPER